MKLNTRSSLKSIKNQVKDDFGVTIDDEMAMTIREHSGRNLIVWTPAHLKCVANDVNFEISRNHVRWFAAHYTAAEWSAL